MVTPRNGKALAYIGLGANLGDPPGQLRAAIEQLARTPGVRVGKISPFYRSAPLGPPGQPDYCNAVCELDAGLPPEALLDLLQQIETAAGRRRDVERWSARVLDLDLLHMPGIELRIPRLSLPHPQLHLRAFVLVPLADVAPGLIIPQRGIVGELAAAVGRAGIEPWI